MKRIISTIVAAIVALSFSAVVFGADATPALAPATATPTIEKKETIKPAKTHKKHHRKQKAAKKVEAPAPAAAPAPAPAPAK